MDDKNRDPIRVGPVRADDYGAQRSLRPGYGRQARVLLPIAAFGLIAALFIPGMFGGDGPSQPQPGQTTRGTRVTESKVTGATAEGSVYVVTVGEARAEDENLSRVELERIQADLTMPNGRRVTMTAPEAVHERQKARAVLRGGVEIATNDGYEAKTDAVLVDIDGRSGASEGRVVGRGPAGRVCAERLILTEADGGVAKFEGDVVVILTDLPDAEQNPRKLNETIAALPAGPEALTVCQKTLRDLKE